MDVLGAQISYSSLSLKDLLEARDAYHWHLMNKANVVGTAVGLYLIRNDDVPRDAPRTFENSSVKRESWPCVIVLVNDWLATTDFGGQKGIDPTHMVPRTLYLTDGRAAPACVVLVRPGEAAAAAPVLQKWPESYIGGGCPLYATVQGEERKASVGCLVTDGHRTFALTNRHVAGEEGAVLSASLRGNLAPVGRASAKFVARTKFSEAFPEFSVQRTFLTVDVSLVDVDVASDWTSQPFGLEGDVGPVADLNEANLGTQLIDYPVEAFGAASGHLTGKIKALFYRHKAIAGYDYVSEFLIAPDDGKSQTGPGDSGTVWYLTGARKGRRRVLRPIAVEWGGQGLIGDHGRRLNFSLATGLSTVCALLDVDVVQPQFTGPTPFWGQTGHYSIATAAVAHIQDPTLKAFMEANIEQLSFRPDELSPDQIRQALASGQFVELADVPDLVWKKVAGRVPGGRDEHQNSGPEHPNHYADTDKPAAGGGESLRQMVLKDPTQMTAPAWQAWYAQNGSADPAHQGILPFRVWQLFKVMVDELQSQGPDPASRFLCAAGVISHYVGDACQPLHGSHLSNGYQDRPIPSSGKTKKWAGMGVHSAYEDKMVDTFSTTLLPMIGPAADKFAGPIPRITQGQEAAFAIISLMDYCAGILPPSSLCDHYIELGGGSAKPVIAGLWDRFSQQTADVMGAGARYLAAIWDAAYEAAEKPALAAQAISRPVLAAIYQDKDFAPSRTLATISSEL